MDSVEFIENETTVHLPENGFCEKEELSDCPKDLLYLSPGVCYVLLKNQTFPPKCPYQNTLPYYKIKSVIKFLKIENNDIWVNAIRNDSGGYGNYEWIERGDSYGESLKDISNKQELNANAKCVFVQNETFISTDCASERQAICVYAYNMSQYCTNNFRRGSCISSHFDFYNGNCYCKIDFSDPILVSNSTCDKLAEPTHPFQTRMLLNGFPDPKNCWFGLKKAANASLSWISTNEPLSYSYWSENHNCSHNEGAIKFGNDSGWILLNNTTLNCEICEIKIEPNESSLELYHDLNKDILNLVIKNPFSIADWNGHFNLYCFSDVNRDDFDYKLNFDTSNLGTNTSVYVLQLPEIKEYPGHYWCSAFQFPYSNMTHSNTIVTYNRTKQYGHEYSFYIQIKTYECDPIVNNIHVFVANYLNAIFSKYQNVISVRPMTLINYDDEKGFFEIIVHLTTKNVHQNHETEYYNLYRTTLYVNMSNPDFIIKYLLSASVCFREYTYTEDGDILEWPEANIGVTAIPVNKLCLDSSNNVLPVTRKCDGSFMYGAKWLDVQGNCEKNPNYSPSTKELFYLLKSDALEQGVEEILADITGKNENNSVVDVHLVSQILNIISNKNANINNSEFFRTINNLMHYNRDVLNGAQDLLNSTDQVLFSLDNFIMQLNESCQYKSNNLILIIIDLISIDCVSILLYANSSQPHTNFEHYSFDILYNNNNILLENEENIEINITIPIDVVNNIKNQSLPKKSLKVVVEIFYNDFLFNERKQDKLTDFYLGNKIVSISWIGYNGRLSSPVQIVYKKMNATNLTKCAYWDYGWDQLMISKYGRWAFDNSSYNKSNTSDYCQFYHTTHFGVFLLNTYQDFSPTHEQFLQILSGIGSALSLLGIIPILVTACIYKKWRRRRATTILIQLCVTIVVQTLLQFLSELITEDDIFCKIIGVGLHYIVLAEFCWMFVIGTLQYRKFVVIMKPPPSNILQVSAIIGWGMPLFPVFITLSISTDNYSLIEEKFCYIIESYFLFFMLLPIILMFVANLYIFIRIFYAIHRVNKTSVVTVKNFKAEIFLAILLFFILGLTWIFAFVSFIGGGLVSTYLYCLSASVRGLVLFLFFIVRNKEVRHLWIKRTRNSLDNSTISRDKGFSELSVD
ncbi:hypothetical protein FQA39_LY13286 [Lamprigera yunnana]|nr:hypothetical protein FQA39_LY13286 [Lamprigera yunnana]